MEKVTSLAERRARKESEGREIIFCTHCGSTQFTLTPLGFVYCANCGATINNISLTLSDDFE